MGEHALRAVAAGREVSARNQPRDLRRRKIACAVWRDVARSWVVGPCFVDGREGGINGWIVRVGLGSTVEAFVRIVRAVDGVYRLGLNF